MAGEPTSRIKNDPKKTVSVRESVGSKIREALGKAGEPIVEGLVHVENNSSAVTDDIQNDIRGMRTEISAAKGKAGAAMETAESVTSKVKSQLDEFEQALKGASTTVDNILRALSAEVEVQGADGGKEKKRLQGNVLVTHIVDELQNLKYALGAIEEHAEPIRGAIESLDEKFELLICYLLKKPFDGKTVTPDDLESAAEMESLG